jgi:hypothetical protein
MNGARDKFFSGARFAGDQHSEIASGRHADLTIQHPHRSRFADKSIVQFSRLRIHGI